MLGSNQPFKAVLFDMDGLMIDSEGLQMKATNQTLAPLRIQFTREEWSLRVGTRSREMFRKLKEERAPDINVEVLESQKSETYRSLVETELQLMPGLREAIAVFKNAGMKLAVGSSSVSHHIHLVLDKFSLMKNFDAIVSGDDVSKGKPDPEVFLKAADKLGVEPRQCMVLEDALVGVIAAKAAGTFAIAVPSEFTLHQDFSIADKVLSSLEEITPEFVASLQYA